MIGAASPSGMSAHFTHYLDNRLLPVSHAEVRDGDGDRNGIKIALVSHLPNKGIWFDAIDDLIISVVMQSEYSSVIRDIGAGQHSFTERPGCILVTPPRTPSYWDFDGSPLVLHLSVPRRFFRDLSGHDW